LYGGTKKNLLQQLLFQHIVQAMGKRYEKPKDLAAEVGRNRPFDSLEQELFLNLIRSAEWLQSEFSKVFKEHGTTQPQFNVLKILQVEDAFGIPIQRIGVRMSTRAPDVTRLVDRLEHSGLVERFRAGQDRRVIYVRLTESGRQMIDRLAQPFIESHAATKGHMGRDKLELLNSLLFELRHSGD
jgi:DNA-binding MarR family transcriptional regulator